MLLNCITFVCLYTDTICACMLTACDNHSHSLACQHTPPHHTDIQLPIVIIIYNIFLVNTETNYTFFAHSSPHTMPCPYTYRFMSCIYSCIYTPHHHQYIYIYISIYIYLSCRLPPPCLYTTLLLSCHTHPHHAF